MPHTGTLDVEAAVARAPAVSGVDTPSWELPDAELVQVNWEVGHEALALVPPALHPSIPPYASFFAARYPVSPVGPFVLAQARLVVRAGIRPRGLCLGAVCDSAAAVDALRQHWGFPVQRGAVTYSSRHDHVRVNASLDGGDVLELSVGNAETITGNDLNTFDNLHLVRLGDAPEGALLQIDPEYTIHQAERGRPSVRLPDPLALGLRGLLSLQAPIVGFTFRADTDLVRPRFRIDPTRPAIEGTTKIASAAA